MARLETVEIVVNGRKKIVNADDPRAKAPQPKKRASTSKAKGKLSDGS